MRLLSRFVANRMSELFNSPSPKKIEGGQTPFFPTKPTPIFVTAQQQNFINLSEIGNFFIAKKAFSPVFLFFYC